MKIRKFPVKDQLCEAVSRRLEIRLKCDDDNRWRTFQPRAVFVSAADKICVTGIQTRDPAKPRHIKPQVADFEVSNIAALKLTGVHFEYDPAFDPLDDRFAKGLVCFVQPGDVI
jgi:hypothetical protein